MRKRDAVGVGLVKNEAETLEREPVCVRMRFWGHRLETKRWRK